MRADATFQGPPASLWGTGHREEGGRTPERQSRGPMTGASSLASQLLRCHLPSRPTLESRLHPKGAGRGPTPVTCPRPQGASRTPRRTQGIPFPTIPRVTQRRPQMPRAPPLPGRDVVVLSHGLAYEVAVTHVAGLEVYLV